VQICPTLGTYLAAALEQEYGVPEIRVVPPYGIPQTDAWIKALGKLTGKEKEAETFIEEEKKVWLPKLEEVKKRLKGKTAYVTTGAAHGHSLLAVLNELGMETVGAAMFHHDPLYDNESENCDVLENAVKNHGDIQNYNVCNKQEFELVNILNRARPDIMLARHGGLTLWGAKLGIPSLLIEDEHFAMGYEGIVNYGERILETIDNDEFVKNLEKHTINPYSKWWIEQQNPYYFLGSK
jgi:nitrogenase molybdenum-iron protein alpha chain